MSTQKCALCGHDVAQDELRVHRQIEAMVLTAVRENHPEWQDEDGVCEKCHQEVKRRVEAADELG